ncbi:MAG: hypothetical protein RBT63_09355 [Bdellovibrionales bacterium]|jgi:hypothetical protein|nr:hypothetical protein [Bdellovibrionales bacterium]
MTSPGSWHGHFKIGDEILGSFRQEHPSFSSAEAAGNSIEFVLWCIQNGHLSEDDFIAWQSEQASLPIVGEAFFESPVDTAFWDRVKDIHPWTQSCLPLAEWEGVLLIGTLWPYESFKASLQHRIVLAAPRLLEAFYARLAPQASKAPQASLTAPAAIDKTFSPTAPSSTPSSAVDNSGDPFAALSRSLGIETNDTSSEDDDNAEFSSADDEAIAMPEGLSFGKDELARLAAQPEEEPSHDRTVVHNFETGEKEVAQRKAKEDPLAESQSSIAPPSILGKSFAQLERETTNESASIHTDDYRDDHTDEPVVSTDVVLGAPTTAKSPVAESGAPAQAAAQSTLAPQPAAQEQESASADIPPALALEIVPPPEEPQMEEPQTEEPPVEKLEAEKLDEKLQVEQPKEEPIVTTPKPRKPLFAPLESASQQAQASTAKETPLAAVPDATSDTTEPGVSSASLSNTSATPPPVTTKSRRLEAPPVTSFIFGAAAATPSTAPASQQSPVTSSISGVSVSKPAPAKINYASKIIPVNKLEPVHLDQCTTIDEAGAQALLQACNIFETSMILLFKDGQLVPWKWSDLFLSVKGEKPESIDLTEPSIFKIVLRTAKPYHGYVVTNLVNQQFFNEFYRGMPPKHATILPIMIDGRMGGMLLGFTNSKIDYRQSLRLMERLSFDLARIFKNLRGTMSKAS